MKRVFTLLFLAIFIVSLAFLVSSPALAQSLDPEIAEPIPIDVKKAPKPWAEYYLSETEYKDPTLHVTIEMDRYNDSDIWITRVKIAHPSQLRTEMSGTYGRQVTTVATTIAKRVNAVIAINGDFYGYRSDGIVIRQGHMYRNRPKKGYDTLLIDEKGDLHALFNADADVFNAVYEKMGGAWDEGGTIINAWTFGPTLIVDDQLAHEEFVRYNTGEKKHTQRMVIAQDGPLSYLLVCCSGPESKNSKGLTIQEMAEYMLTLDCDIAYNLDGGSSSSLVFNNKKVNSLDTHKKRPISDIIYFATALIAEEVE